MNIENLKENQIAFYVVLFEFSTGPALVIIKKNGLLIARWPALDEFKINSTFIQDTKGRGSYVAEEREIILKENEYVFLIRNQEPLIGDHKYIIDKLKTALIKGGLTDFETTCIKHYLENES